MLCSPSYSFTDRRPSDVVVHDDDDDDDDVLRSGECVCVCACIECTISVYKLATATVVEHFSPFPTEWCVSLSMCVHHPSVGMLCYAMRYGVLSYTQLIV